MNREELKNIIKKEIQSVAFEYLKELNNTKNVTSTNDYLNSKHIDKDDFDSTLFHGGETKEERDEKKRGPITIKESDNKDIKITTTEIDDFENSFNEILNSIPGASIIFDMQQNNYSLIASRRSDGIEVRASGVLDLGDSGKVVWTYSRRNGLKITAQNLKLDDSNKMMFEALSNHYKVWEKKWREKISMPPAIQAEPSATSPLPAGPEPTAAPSPTV